MRTTIIYFLSALALGCGGHRAAPAQAPTQTAGDERAGSKPDLPTREELPLEAREMLTARMLRHGEQMTVLMASVVLLDYDATEALAEDLAQEPRLGRPAPGEKETLNALLPPAFFAHQDELVTRSRALGAAAKAHDDGQLVEAFAAVAKTCVGCHAVYLHEALDIPEHEEPGDSPPCDPGDACDANDGSGPHAVRNPWF